MSVSLQFRVVNAGALPAAWIGYGRDGARDSGSRPASEHLRDRITEHESPESAAAESGEEKALGAEPRHAGASAPAEERPFMADVLDVTDQTFEAEVLQSDTPAIVDFWAEWCAPCRQVAPIVKELAAEFGDRIKIVKIDIDSNPSTPGRFGIRAIPTILAFREGQVVQQLQGARPKTDFEDMVKNLLG